MLFDQYSRYNALKQLLNKSEFNENKTLLDIGSGPECLLGSVLDSHTITYLDPLITKQNDEHYITGNIFTKKLENKKFNYVTAIDVLEHIPLSIRKGFIEKLCELSNEYIIIAFPSSENKDARDVDNYVNEEYKRVYGKDYPWLEEHFEYGLPSLKETVAQMEDLGWKCKTIGHGYAPWLKNMLGFTICSWDILENHDILLDMSEKFNIELCDYDFSSSKYYRDYIVASKKNIINLDSLIKEKNSFIKERFQQILDESKMKVFEKNFQIIKQSNAIIEELNIRIQDVSTWAKSLQEELQKNLKASNHEINNLKLLLTNQTDELMKMSDWATQMRIRLEKIDNSFIIRNTERVFSGNLSFLTIVKKVIKKLLSTNILNKYRFYKQKVNFDEVKQSVNIHEKIIIAFPIITWGFRFQRPQHILKELSKKGYTIIYLAMDMSPKGVLFDSIYDAGADVDFTKLDENIYKIWLHSYENINIYTDYISDENLNNLSLSIQSAIKVLKPKEITYMVQFPGWNRLVFDLKSKYNGKVVFDCMDDHSGFSTNDDNSLKEELELIKDSDIVISSSQLLYDKNVKLNDNTIQVKNGTEFNYFNSASKNGKLDYLANKPIIGYYGAISDWFDMDIVEYCAKKLPDYNFVMIGATFGCDISDAEQIDNIHFLGEIPYKELTGYFAYFDVCLIPFKIIPLTFATNPVKFYEYLSAGKPVVSVRLPELIPYEEHCYLAGDKEEFCTKIDEALEEKSKSKIENRVNLAKENSWSKRADMIHRKIIEG